MKVTVMDSTTRNRTPDGHGDFNAGSLGVDEILTRPCCADLSHSRNCIVWDRALILTWIDKPDGLEKRTEGFWRAASKSVLAEVMYETAMERQRKLPLHEWVVGCLITEGIKQEEIADILHKSERTVDKTVLDIKHRIVQELGCDVESVNPLQISRWFLGL